MEGMAQGSWIGSGGRMTHIEMVEFTIPGKLQRWQRRVQTKSGFSFNPKEYTAFKEHMSDIATKAMAGRPPYTGPIELYIYVWWPRPKGKVWKTKDNDPYPMTKFQIGTIPARGQVML